MPHFAYRAELKGPGPLDKVDFSNPALAPLIRMTAANLQREAREWAAAPPPGVQVRRQEIPVPGAPDLLCYVVEPREERSPVGLLYCHGGAFFLPVQAAALRLAARYAAVLGARVVLPEYRLLPDFRAPTAFWDCLAAWAALNEGRFGPVGTTLLYGESAGGALAAGAALYARDHGLPRPGGISLIYPVLDDLRGSYPSRCSCDGAAWTLRSERFMWQAYLPDPAALRKLETYLVPMRATDVGGLPSVYIEPQEFDILRDEALAFAQRLEEAGVPVSRNLIQGSYHGFDADTHNPFVRRVITQRLEALRLMLDNKGVEENL